MVDVLSIYIWSASYTKFASTVSSRTGVIRESSVDQMAHKNWNLGSWAFFGRWNAGPEIGSISQFSRGVNSENGM